MAKADKQPLVFSWRGTDRNGREISGDMEAPNLQVAKLLLRRQSIKVSKIRKQSQSIFGSAGAIKVKDIVFFTRQLTTMIESGIPIATCMRGIAQGHENQALRQLVTTIRQDVEAGTTLSAALKKHPQHFNRLYTGLVAVGEQSGTLDVLMNKIASSLEKLEHIKGKIRSAMFYPILVMVVAFVIVAVLLIFVIPEFESLFSEYGADLPALTLWVVGASETFQEYWFRITAGFIAFIVLMVFTYRRSPKVQLIIDGLVLRVPIFGAIIRKAIIARVARTLSTTFSAGIPLVDSLHSVAQVTGNLVYTNGLLDVRREVSTGRSLEESMTETGLFPGMMLQMVSTGEEAGELERMLDKIAEFFETEVDNSIATISSLIEPFLIIFIGGIVGTIVVAMYLPIFQLGGVF